MTKTPNPPSFHSSLLCAVTLFTGIGGGILALVIWQNDPDETINLAVFLILIWIMANISITLGHHVYRQKKHINELEESTFITFPKVIHSVKEGGGLEEYKGAAAVLIVENTPLLGHDCLASIFIDNDGFERLIGIGRVVNIQRNGNIQMTAESLSSADAWKDILNNDKAALNKIIIKPTLSFWHLWHPRS